MTNPSNAAGAAAAPAQAQETVQQVTLLDQIVQDGRLGRDAASRERGKELVKEFVGDKNAAIDEGKIDWKTLLETYETVGGTEWYIVEYEAANPMEKIKVCLDNLHKMGR